jgi:hypothetical protein
MSEGMTYTTARGIIVRVEATTPPLYSAHQIASGMRTSPGPIKRARRRHAFTVRPSIAISKKGEIEFGFP